ncbi:MAG: hypothetical protein ACKV0T_01115 [Planctomycetales bacterium]
MSEQSPQRFGNMVRWWHIVLFLFLTTVLLTPIGIRTARLAGVPDIPHPFDVAAFGSVQIAPEENAFTLYSQLRGALSPMPRAAGDQYEATIAEGWGAAGPELRAWVEQNRGLLEMFRVACERPDAMYLQPSNQTLNTIFEEVHGLRELSRLAILEGARLEHEGDDQGAWDCYRMVLQCSRHVGRHGGRVERQVGAALHRLATDATLRWCQSAALDPQALRTALQEVRAIYLTSIPDSETLKTEYLVCLQALGDPELFQGPGGTATQQLMSRNPLTYILGEPELSLRVVKLYWTNIMSGCDLPRNLRPTAIDTYGLRDCTIALPDGQTASPQEIAAWLRRTTTAAMLFPNCREAVNTTDREVARQMLLKLALSIQRYQREQGTLPRSLSDLNADFSGSLPTDLFGSGEPLRFRVEEHPAEGITLWSLGADEVDDEGRVEAQLQFTPGPGDIIVKVRPLKHPELDE